MKAHTIKLNGEYIMLMQDDDGLVSLNDLHKLSGHNESKRPGNWLRQGRIQSRLDRPSSIYKVKAGHYGGTWVDERLALIYAAWIDEEFEDAVYDAFEKVSKGDVEAAQKAVHDVYRRSARDYYTGEIGRKSNRADNTPVWQMNNTDIK